MLMKLVAYNKFPAFIAKKKSYWTELPNFPFSTISIILRMKNYAKKLHQIQQIKA